MAPRRTAPSQHPALQASRTLQRETGHGHFAPYQAIILAEFVTAELLVAITPIATRKNQPGLSPYVPRDLTKLAAIGMVFFLLELMAVGGAGTARIGAWVGGLVLLVVGMNQGANVAKDLNIFGMHEKPAKPAKGPAGGQAV